jgi:hypothetical protein
MRGVRLLTLLLLAAGTVPAMAQTRRPVCREDSVVDQMTREVRAQNYYTSVNPRLVTEQPTADPNVVRCQVCVQSEPYDTLRFGERPIERCLAHEFEVQIKPGGFVVRDLR